MQPVESTQPTIHQEILAEDAYDRVEPELLALPADKVLTINLDVSGAASTALGCIPKLVSLKGQLEEELRKFDLTLVDRIEAYAYAVLYAHSMYQCETRAPADLQVLLESGIRLRELLHKDADTLKGRGLIPEESLRDFDGLVGYMNVANDLLMLCAALKGNWDKIDGRCATTREELDFAARLAGRIIRLVGEREQSSAKLEEAADKRSRAFTLFFNCYEQIRRGVTYVRWDVEDADDYAPSLHTTSRKSHRSEAKSKDAAPSPAPGDQGFNNPSPFMPAGSPAPTRTGIPGGNPFTP